MSKYEIVKDRYAVGAGYRWCLCYRASGDPISSHKTEKAARAALKREEAEDRHLARIADKVDGYDRDDLGESHDY